MQGGIKQWEREKALCIHRADLLYAIKLVKLKIVNDTVTSIIGKEEKLRRILSDVFKCDFLTRARVHARTKKNDQHQQTSNNKIHI